MIDITQLAQETTLRGNYFSPDTYVQGDREFGLLENRSGSRLLALPEPFVKGLYASLEQEIGTGTGAVLMSCGRWWGKSFFRRLVEELKTYYGQPLEKMEMIQFLQCLKQCWKVHGWGVLDLDFKYYQQGFIVVKIENSPFVATVTPSNRPMGFLEAGVLSAFFSQLTGEDLYCVQTACESLAADCNYFVIGLGERLKTVNAWLEEGHDHATIMELLCRH